MVADSTHSPTRSPLVLKVEYAHVDEFLEDYAVNISRGGAMIEVGPEVAVGDQVELHLTFPALHAPLTVRGVVRWVEGEGGAVQHAGVELDRSAEALGAVVQRIRDRDRAIVGPIVRVLIVEDNPHVAKLLTDGLEAFRKRSAAAVWFVTRYAANGGDALMLLTEGRHDLLLCDMYLPVLDGEALIRAQRSQERTRELPVVALSAGGRDAREGAVAAGADFFLEKPIRLTDVLAVLQKIVGALLKRC
jgi:uncharacterized protein (TIGR02266 family)